MSTVFASITTPGPAGPPGRTPLWLTGTLSPPVSGIGLDGDMYLNTLVSDVYGPKASGLWGTLPVANIAGLPGATGPTGPAGYSPLFIVNAGPPAPAAGHDGDMYLDSATSNLYGPKATLTGWGGIVANIKGATGATGAPGVAYTAKGDWSSIVAYNQGEEVTSSSILYISLTSTGNTNKIPASNPTFWQVVAAAGAQTPWVGNIAGAGFSLQNTGFVGVGVTAAIQVTAGRRYITIKGSTDAGIIELSQGSADADGAVVGHMQFSDANSTAGDKRAAAILVSLDGVSATNRGGAVRIFTKSDGVSTFSEKVRITQGGNVGIGTTTPGIQAVSTRVYLTIKGATDTGVLELASGSADADGAGLGFVQFTDNGSTAGDKRAAAIFGALDGTTPTNRGGAIRFFTKSDGVATFAERMRITQGGFVGIAKTPALPLDVEGTIRSSSGVIDLRLQATTTAIVGTFSNTDLLLFSNGAERLRITAAGNAMFAAATQVRIGSATAPAYALDVTGDCNVAGAYRVNGTPMSSGGFTAFGIGKTPAYALDVQGDCNITGTFRVAGTPISGGGITTQTNATASRAINTVYQNTSGKPMFVTIYASCNAGTFLQANTDSTTNPSLTVALVNNTGASSGNLSVSFWVLPGNYYKGLGGTTLNGWLEWT